MGAADDIKKGLVKNLANFTKQRKAEERHSTARPRLLRKFWWPRNRYPI